MSISSLRPDNPSTSHTDQPIDLEAKVEKIVNDRNTTKQVLEFVKNLKNPLNATGCQEAIVDLNDANLCVYLYRRMKREEEESQLDGDLQTKFKNFLENIGNKLHGLTNDFDKARSSGKGFEGFLEILSLLADHSNSTHHKNEQYEELEFLASSLADREPMKGLIVSLPDRNPKLWKVDFAQERGGAFIYVLIPVDSAHQDTQPNALVVCRGTAGRKTASGGIMSLYNDVIEEIGAKGVDASWGDLKTYLQTKSFGNVEVMGKSLGGAVAQQLSVLIQASGASKVNLLRTLQSTGVHDSVHNAYRDLSDKFPIKAFRHAQVDGKPMDLVPKLGGFHLGKKVENFLEIYDVGTNKESELKQARTFKKVASAFWHLIRALGSTHVLQMRRKKNFVVTRRNKVNATSNEGHLRTMEKTRLFLIRPLVYFLKWLNRKKYSYRPFSEILKEEKNLKN